MAKREEFLQRLRATFKVEAEEHLQALSSGLLELEQEPSAEKQTAVVETLYREAHSLKGAARAVDMTDVEETSHSLEGVLAALKRGEIAVSGDLLDNLRRVVDGLGKLLSSPQEVVVQELQQQLARLEVGENDHQPVTDASRLQEEVEAVPDRKSEAGAPEKPETRLAPLTPADSESAGRGDGTASVDPSLPETIRIATAKLDALLLQTEEMLAAKLAAAQQVADLREVYGTLDGWKKEWDRVAPEIRGVRKFLERKEGGDGQDPVASSLAPVLEFADWSETYIKSLETRLNALAESAEGDRRSVGQMVDQLLEDVKQVLMHPFASFAASFPRLVRELARDQGKEAELVLEGGEVEIDRRILAAMKDPLVHLLRNAVDHGIEAPEERERNGKPRRGTATVALSQVSSSRVEIRIADDGAGIDLAAVKAAAVQRRIASPEEADRLDEQEVLELIFQSDVSTRSLITDISGRGLGLAIAREKVEDLGGSLSVETSPGTGTSFRMLLPLTLATFRGILVQAADQLFVIPTGSVERVLRVRQEEIKTVENRETIPLNGSAVPLAWLADVLELPGREEPGNGSTFRPTLILGTAENRIAFGVEAVLGEQVVLIKGLGPQLSRVRNVAGATVLGSGQVAPILNVPDLLKSAVQTSGVPARFAAAVKAAEEPGDAILVVEDSITSRMLLKNILEAAGYPVKTTVDGVEALTELKAGSFDLVVSDVQMPRMDGFELTKKIREDDSLAELPVVLVTALESREDRERGIDAGANAYIVKSSFDQSNLLETIRRLI